MPDDPEHIIYVWFDALGNYITALEVHDDASKTRHYWRHVEGAKRGHVLGKGITRFHATYWPAILLSAGLSPPTDIVVHGYLTVDGDEIGKSRANAIDPVPVLGRIGADTFRYWATRKVRFDKDADSSCERLRQVHAGERADQLGNLVARTTSLIVCDTEGRVPSSHGFGHRESSLVERAKTLGALVEQAFAEFRIDEALDYIWKLIEHANR